MASGVSRRSDETVGHSLHYGASLPGGLTVLVLALPMGALIAVASPAVDAGMPRYVLTAAAFLIGTFGNIGFERRVTLTADGRLLITGFGQCVDVDSGRIIAITVSRRGRLGFGTAMVHRDGGKFPIWQTMRYTPEPRSRWSWRYVSGRGGKDFGDLVYRLRAHNPTLIIEGVKPPAWALPQPTPHPPHWW